MRILFTGGGSGGHIFPIIAVARELKKIYQQAEPLEMFFVGPSDFSKGVLENEGIKTKTILAGKIRRYFSMQNLIDLFKMPISFFQAFCYVFILMPDVIFSKGGYGSVAVVLVGWLFRIPVLTHESDAVPGLANRLAAKFSRIIAVSFSLAEGYFPVKKTALIGNPIRSEVIQLCLSPEQTDKEKARTLFQINSQRPVILVLGGSQGAQAVNELIALVLPQLLGKYELIHQCGEENYQQIENSFSEKAIFSSGYHLIAFLDETQLASAYLLADLVISRAGAGSIFEIAACAKPSILIPLPNSAGDHQRKNAFTYAQAGATTVLDQENLTPNIFLNEINRILDNSEISQQMKTNAQSFSQPEAAQKISQALIEIGK